MHSPLVSSSDDLTLPYLHKCETDLGRTSTEDQKRIKRGFTVKSFICTRTQENNFKIFTGWYRTPSGLHKYFTEEQRMLLHIFWSCPRPDCFWKEVRRIPQKFTIGCQRILPFIFFRSQTFRLKLIGNYAPSS